VAANFDAVAGFPVVVRRVNDPGGQPENTLLDLIENCWIVAGRGLSVCQEHKVADQAQALT
jgi:hypothetical protein